MSKPFLYIVILKRKRRVPAPVENRKRKISNSADEEGGDNVDGGDGSGDEEFDKYAVNLRSFFKRQKEHIWIINLKI